MKTLLLAPLSLLLVACSEQPEPLAGTAAVEGVEAPEAPAPVIEHVDAAGAAALLADGAEVTILDIRTPEEFESGHLAGAVNIDFKASDFAANLGELDKAQTYLVHCASGGRSGKSLKLFEEAGFAHVVHLDGGIRDWTAGGHPVEQ